MGTRKSYSKTQLSKDLVLYKMRRTYRCNSVLGNKIKSGCVDGMPSNVCGDKANPKNKKNRAKI